MKKGDLVCELDSASLRDQLTNQKIATQGAEATYQNAKLTRETAEIAVRSTRKESTSPTGHDPGRDQAGRIRPSEGQSPVGADPSGSAEADRDARPERGDHNIRRHPRRARYRRPSRCQRARTPPRERSRSRKPKQAEPARELHQGKTLKELMSEVEKARSDELAKKQRMAAREGQGSQARKADPRLQALCSV